MQSSPPDLTTVRPDPRLIAALREAVDGEVLCDAMSLGLYATDASMFQITPLAVVVARGRRDVLGAMRVAAAFGVPILPRGGGTSLTGQTVGQAVVIDVSKHMNKLLEVNEAERWARVEPGLVRDELNAMLRPRGLHFAPDPATASRANVGGMIANNSGGMRSIRYGMTIDHLLGADVALATGEVLNLRELSAPEWAAKTKLGDREGEIYRGFEALIEANREEIVARYPKVRRRSGGYMLDAFAGPMPWNLTKILAASEGTLGMVLEAIVKLEPLPRFSGLCVAHFDTLARALRSVSPIVAHGPTAVEMIDGLIVSLAKTSPLTRDRCDFVEGEPTAILLVEFQSDDEAEVRRGLAAVAEELRRTDTAYHAYACPELIEAGRVADAWVMRANGLGLLTTVKGDHKPVPFIEDAAVPLEVLPDYIEEVIEICERHGRRLSLFAHASVGLLHMRPLLNLHDPDELEELAAIQREVFARAKHYGGSWSGEHGDGLVRGAFNREFFGDRIYEAFRELKRLFDPAGLMNPGKLLETPPVIENRRHLRYMPGYGMKTGEPMFHYREDGGLRQAVEQCTGTGVCRQTLSGTMCPSYIATRDEEHSTRGRGNALRLAMTGQMGGEGLASPRLREVMDLCISCKGCAKECPNHVDMAKLKAEVGHAYHRKHGASWGERLFGGMAGAAAWGSGAPARWVNGAMELAGVRWAMERWAGVDRRRPLPALESLTLSRWFAARGAAAGPEAGRRGTVALFLDTYLEHFDASIGRAAVEVLEAAGYEVELAAAGCCQRPLLSKGFLDRARRGGEATLRALDEWATRGVPILVVEPSCASALVDDLPDLIEDEELGKRVAGAVRLLDDFLGLGLASGEIQLPFLQVSTEGGAMPNERLLVHGHCHQKAVFGMRGTMAMLGAVPGLEPVLIEAGCCGMAGSFGYEVEHFELSAKIAEDRLLPALRREPGTGVAACGTSCRHQIGDLGERRARHPVQILRDRLG